MHSVVRLTTTRRDLRQAIFAQLFSRHSEAMDPGYIPSSLPLEGNFQLYGQKNGRCVVRLDPSELTVTRVDHDTKGERRQTIKTEDIVGCVCMKGGEKEQRRHVAFITVYAYPLFGSSKKKGRRKRLALTIEVEEKESFEENLDIANRWRTTLLQVARSRGQVCQQIDRHKKLLVLINPNSGPGKALQIYKKQVAALYGEAELEHEVVVTERANHVFDLVRTLDLNLYAGSVIISGDGLLFEFYNGLLQRPDWQQAIQFPVGIIPGGSGNGLASSIAHWQGEPYLANPVLVSTLNQVCGRVSPMDLVLVQTPEGKKTLSFLSLGLGLLSDIDIESERLRSLGETRFTIWAIARWANLRKYKATISFRRVKGRNANFHKIRPVLERSQTVEEEQATETTGTHERLLRSSSTMPETSRLSNSSFDLTSSLVKVECNPAGQQQEIEVGEEVLDQESRVNHNQGAVENHNKSNGNPEVSRRAEEEEDFKLPEFSETLPHDWETIEGETKNITSLWYMHAIRATYQVMQPLAPSATPNDGIIWLLLVRGNATKANVLKFLLGLDGSHLNIPGVELIPVDAMRVIPHTAKGTLTVDGEVIPWGPIQANMLAGKGKIITR
ncbi:sphingosine kinase 2-like [Penaeus chinensis]|uniref:sphingosine kinase 2-like n=1 Tax=Penaeus chinensis TaxID=139456 RepID=UPI001FB74728|nr:sphingosine kinase 2-like [Penaeus chinensis]